MDAIGATVVAQQYLAVTEDFHILLKITSNSTAIAQ